MPSGESNASGAEKEKGKKIKGGIFRRTAEASDRGYVHQLQNTLYLPANTMVVTAGGYKFMDYVKSGFPLIVIATIVSMVILPIAFPFFP